MNYKFEANEARKKILAMVHSAGTSHIASNFSVIDIATVLYANLKEGDEVVWSAGWKAASIYYFLAKQGKIPEADLDRFAKEENGKIEYLGLAETNVPGVWVNGGAVGHGTAVAVGMAYGKKLKEEQGTIHCILSDGELNEGTVWESAMLAKKLKLDNLIFWIDANGWQAMGRAKDVIDVDAVKAFEGFGWVAYEIDGHDYQSLEIAHFMERKQPTVFLCNTVKGKGVSFFEDKILYHYAHIDKETYAKALLELQKNI